MTFHQRPHGNPVRKALLKIHLWTGLIVALYVILIGGSKRIETLRKFNVTAHGIR